jgi:hypothetical protein
VGEADSDAVGGAPAVRFHVQLALLTASVELAVDGQAGFVVADGHEPSSFVDLRSASAR